MGTKFLKINYIDEATQNHRVVYISYRSDIIFNAFLGKQGLIIKDQIPISAVEYHQAPKDKKIRITTGKESINPSEKESIKNEKKKGFFNKLFGR